MLNSIIPDCTGLKTTWTNIKADQQFPVSTGTVMSLSCNVGHEIRGDATVTCTTNTKFQFTVEPNCGRNDCGQIFQITYSCTMYIEQQQLVLFKTMSLNTFILCNITVPS